MLAAAVGDSTTSHSNSLLRDIAACLERAAVAITEVALFAAASGPGSFTGLRIGLATVKALAATLSRPCVGVPTLYAIARSAGPAASTVALLPAGRGELFAQMFSVSVEERVSERDAPAHLSPGKMLEKYGALTNLKWSGEGAHLHGNLLRAHARGKGVQFREIGLDLTAKAQQQGWSLAPEEKNLGKHVAALALELLERGNVVAPHSLTAIYIRPSDAELKCP